MNRIVVADAGPLHYLVLIGCADLLEKLFDRILIPTAVRDELVDRAAPEKIKTWIGTKRSWLSVASVAQPQQVRGLHKGEAQSLQLALQSQASGVLMDDLDGRAAARRLGISVVGTLGVLERMAELKMVQLPDTLAKLRQTNFFASPELFDAVLERNRKRGD